MSALAPLPVQATGLAWPTEEWPEGSLTTDVDAERVESALARLFRHPPPEDCGETLAVLAVHRGRLVLERYGPGHDRGETFISWSMAKSIAHALVGSLVGEGRLDPAAPAPVPGWSGADDPRREIALEHLLRMKDGLDFTEDYVDRNVSHVMEMLFDAGKDDVAGYAEARPLAHAPGTVWNYSSGTSNVVGGILRRTVGGEAEMLRFMAERLFDRIGMRTAKPRFDAAGTFIASSFVFATARDFARFGLLYLRDGVWDGTRLLPAGWVDHARTLTPGSGGEYGAHWWMGLGGDDAFFASGFNGQYILVVPSRDLVVVRLGISSPEQRERVRGLLTEVIGAFPQETERG